MYYIIIDENNKIIASHYSNSQRPIEEIEVTKEEYKLIKNQTGYIYKYIDGEIIEVEDPNYIEELRLQKIHEAKQLCNENIISGFEFEGDIYQLDVQDQVNYNAMSEKKNKLPSQIEITLKNGEFKMLDTSKLEQFTDAAFNYKMAALQEYKDKVKAIRACATIEELEEV